MELRYWLSQHRKRLLRLSPMIILTLIGVFGLLFPDQIKLVLAQPGEIAIHSGHAQPKHLRLTSIAIFLIVLGLIQIFLTWYSDVQAERPDPGTLKDKEFLQAYTDALVNAVSLLAFLSNFDEARRARTMGEILQILCTVAEVCKGDQNNHQYAFNACFYRVIEENQITSEQRAKASPFMDKDRTAYSTFLELSQWAYSGEPRDPKRPGVDRHPSPCVQLGLVLPVDDNKQYTLFGAPLSFKNAKIYAINDIKDVRRLKRLPGMMDNAVRDTVLDFFRRVTSYRSFVCLPIHNEKGNYGVVSIQSNSHNLCNLNNKFDQQMLMAMEPFLTVLALLLAPQQNANL